MATMDIAKKLHRAAMEGNVTELLALLQQDPLLLDRISLINGGLSDPPLHVAALVGHSDFAAQILQRNPRLATKSDFYGFTPLHMAAAKGHLEIIRLLLQVKVDIDLCLLLDSDGRNPLHLAAMNGCVDCLRELIGARPEAARVLVDHDGTILHLCVKNNQLESLKVLVEAMDLDDDIIFLNAKDDYGFTILHLAVSNKQIQMVEYLVSIKGMEVNGANSNGLTALDILVQSNRDPKDLDIAELLRAHGATRSTNRNQTSNFTTDDNHLLPPRLSKNQTSGSNSFVAGRKKFLESDREALMVVATVIATIAFQGSINPPGGPWQSDEPNSNPIQVAGKSIMAVNDPDRYSAFIMNCTVSFILSMIELFLLLTGFPTKRSVFWVVVYYIIGAAISFIGLAYWEAIRFLTSGTPVGSRRIILELTTILVVACVSIGILLLINTRKLLVKLIERLRRRSS